MYLVDPGPTATDPWPGGRQRLPWLLQTFALAVPARRSRFFNVSCCAGWHSFFGIAFSKRFVKHFYFFTQNLQV
jgi:hypothetical protein